MGDREHFEYRIVPKNNWELVWWVITDRYRIDDEYIHKLPVSFLKVYFLNVIPVTIIFSGLIWLAVIFLISMVDLPNKTPEIWWNNDFLTAWQHHMERIPKMCYLLKEQSFNFIFGLFFGLILGFISKIENGLITSWASGIILGLVFSISFGLLWGVANHGLFSWGIGLILAVVFGIFNSFFKTELYFKSSKTAHYVDNDEVFLGDMNMGGLTSIVYSATVG